MLPCHAGTCLEAVLPRSTDLIIIENLGDLHGGQINTVGVAMERGLLRMQLHFRGRMPAIIFLNMHFLIPPDQQEKIEHGELCIRKPSLCSTRMCSHVFKTLPLPRHSIASSERLLHDLARYYGVASVSHTALMHSLIRDGVHLRMNMSRCQLFSLLYKDRVHPSPTGKLLLVSPSSCWPGAADTCPCCSTLHQGSCHELAMATAASIIPHGT